MSYEITKSALRIFGPENEPFWLGFDTFLPAIVLGKRVVVELIDDRQIHFSFSDAVAAKAAAAEINAAQLTA